jgi:hypothetical protein
VVHNYHDYANEGDRFEESIDTTTEDHPQSAMNHDEQNFQSVHYMLNELEKDGMDDIVFLATSRSLLFFSFTKQQRFEPSSS